MTEPATEDVDPLREFLLEGLPPEPVGLDGAEMITDAVIVFRVVDPMAEDEDMPDHIVESYRYTTTSGVTLGMAMGMLDIGRTTMRAFYTRALEDEDGDDDAATG
jgi:hypothetical protein